MTPDPRRFAELLAGYCLDVRAGQQVLVRSSTPAAPLLLALQREILEREAWPVLRTALPGSPRRSSGQPPRSRISRWSASTSGAASVPARTSTCSPGWTSRQ